MRKIPKKVLALLLTITLLVTGTIPAFAQTTVSNVDVYAEGCKETVTLGGEKYEYRYGYDTHNNKMVEITNIEAGATNVLIYDEATGQMYLDGNVVAFVEKGETNSFNNIQPKDVGWNYVTGPSTTRISFATGISAAAVAAIIATAVGSIGGAAVIAAMGLSALSVIAAGSIGGVVTTTLYKLNSNITH